MLKTKKILIFDIYILLTVFLLSLIGIMFIYSSGFTVFREVRSHLYIKQTFFVLIGFLVMWLATVINYQKLTEHKLIIYLITLAILIIVLFFGKKVNNARRWMDLYFFTVQPSEISKITFIIVLGGYLDQMSERLNEFKNLLFILLLISIPFILILLEPDLGTSLVLLPITIIMLFVAGLSIKIFSGIIMLLGIGSSIPLFLAYARIIGITENRFIEIFSNQYYLLYLALFFLLTAFIIFIINLSMRNIFLYNLIFFLIIIGLGLISALIIENYLKDYQKERLLVFINPEHRRWGSGYNIIQSIIAVGSGGFWGKGYLQGTQSQLGFLPEQSTDFIFSLMGEEIGFVGTAAIILLYVFLLYRIGKLALNVKDYLGGYICIGIFTMFFIHVFVNIGMVIGLAPVTGLPLPFITAGGSSQLVFMFSVGLLFNIEIRKYVHN